jgi:hypothetical protein
MTQIYFQLECKIVIPFNFYKNDQMFGTFIKNWFNFFAKFSWKIALEKIGAKLTQLSDWISNTLALLEICKKNHWGVAMHEQTKKISYRKFKTGLAISAEKSFTVNLINISI